MRSWDDAIQPSTLDLAKKLLSALDSEIGNLASDSQEGSLNEVAHSSGKTQWFLCVDGKTIYVKKGELKDVQRRVANRAEMVRLQLLRDTLAQTMAP